MFIDMFFFLLLFVFMVSKHRKKSQEDLVSKVPRFGKWTQPSGSNNFTVSVSQNEPLQEGPPQFISWFITHPILSNVCVYMYIYIYMYYSIHIL